MRGGCRMDHQALGVAHIGQVREELESFDEAASSFQASADAESKNASGAARQIALRQSVIAAGWQSGIVDPRYTIVMFQELRHRQRVVRVLRHAQFQRLQSLQKQERIE